MNHSTKRFAQAKQRIEEVLIGPCTELIESAMEVVAEARYEAKQTKDVMEQLRPHWAMGYSDDSSAAQASTAALSQIWTALGVDNQTAAMEKLNALLESDL